MLYYPFIELDMRMAKNWKAFKRFFSALSVLDKTIKCYNKTSFVRIQCNLSSKSANLVCLMAARMNVRKFFITLKFRALFSV